MSAGAPERMRRVISAGAVSFQSSAIRKDGSIATTEISARKAMTCDGPVVVAVIHDLSERAEAETRLIYLAYHDALTGLPNRASLDNRLGAAIADSKRYGDILAVAYIDLDRFKPINDRYGHAVGDAVLIELGRRLMSCVRAQDFVARIGGDEFVVLLPRLSGTEELQQIAERLIAGGRKPFSEAGVDHGIGISIGFVLFDEQVDDARSLIVKADVAMYAAKRDPHRSWRVWDEALGMGVPSS
jgi:diguanylate cyclase (GGDEF)-like protein